jgi:DNA-binding MarR family transcriptional regulator
MDLQKNAARKEERPFFHLKQATHFAHIIIRKILNNHLDLKTCFPKLTPVQTMVLRHLMVEDGISQARLAELSGKDNPGMTRILDNMEKQEMVTRKRCCEDRRVSKVFLTSKARKRVICMEPIFDELTDIVFKDFTVEEIRTFGSMCRRIVKNCQNEIES